MSTAGRGFCLLVVGVTAQLHRQSGTVPGDSPITSGTCCDKNVIVLRSERFTMPGPLEETSEEGWHASVNGNLTATFLTLKSILPSMKQRKSGAIVTISSSAGRRPHPQAPIPYSAAKAGIQILTQDVAAQTGPHGIRVNCIAPDTILTERNRQRIPEAQQKAMADMHPLKRLGTPEDVARAALYLVSVEAAWITGVILDVAGGAVMV